MMGNAAINSHEETTAQPASKQQLLWNGSPCTSLLLSTVLYGMEYLTALGQLSSRASSQTPCLLGAEWGREKALMLHKHWSAVAETLVHYQHLFGHKSKTQHYAGCHEKSQLHASWTQYTTWNPCPVEVGYCLFLLIMLSCFIFSLLHSQKSY